MLLVKTGGKDHFFYIMQCGLSIMQREFGPLPRRKTIHRHTLTCVCVCESDYDADVNALLSIRVQLCSFTLKFLFCLLFVLSSRINSQRAELDLKGEEQQQLLGKWRRRERIQVAEQPAAHHDRQNDGTTQWAPVGRIQAAGKWRESCLRNARQNC